MLIMVNLTKVLKSLDTMCMLIVSTIPLTILTPRRVCNIYSCSNWNWYWRIDWWRSVGGGTTEVLKDIGSNVLGKVGKKLVEDGVDMALDHTQTATENGGLTGKDVLFSAVTSFGGDLVGAAKTNSTARNQLIDGATDNRAIKDAVGDSVSDASKNTTKYIDTPYGKAFQENSE